MQRHNDHYQADLEKTQRVRMLDLHNLAEKTPSDGLPVIQKISSTCSYYHYLCDGVDDRVSRIIVKPLYTLLKERSSGFERVQNTVQLLRNHNHTLMLKVLVVWCKV